MNSGSSLFFTRLMVQPPKPPPIMREPVTPQSRARSLRKSSSSQLTVVLAEAAVGFVHAASYGVVVAGDEGVADIEHALFFLDAVFCAEIVFGCDIGADGVGILHCGVAQGLNAQTLGPRARTIGAVCCMGSLPARVSLPSRREPASIRRGMEGEVLILHRAAVQTHEVVFLPKTEANWSMMPQFTPQ